MSPDISTLKLHSPTPFRRLYLSPTLLLSSTLTLTQYTFDLPPDCRLSLPIHALPMIPPDGPVRPSSPAAPIAAGAATTAAAPLSSPSSPTSSYSFPSPSVPRKPLPDHAATAAASSFPSDSNSDSVSALTPSSAPPAAPPPPPPPPGEAPREHPHLHPPIAFSEHPSLAPLSPASLASSSSSLVDEDSLPVVPRDLDRYVWLVSLSLSSGALSASCALF